MNMNGNIINRLRLLRKSSFFCIEQNIFPARRNDYGTLKQFCTFRKNTNAIIINQVRKYSANENAEVKQSVGLKVLKYVSGFIGVCVLTAFGGRLYKKLQLQRKGIEPVKSRHYGLKHTAYHYRGYVVPSFVVDIIDDVNSFNVKNDDIWLVGFPKSGTTWLGELIYLINNEANFDSVKTKIDDRFPYFEYFYPGIKVVDKMPSPRYIKTHLPFSLLPKDFAEKKPKTIYIARNPKDTVVSFHFFLQEFFVKSMWNFSLSFEDYCQMFVDDEVHYGPWWKHVVEGWKMRNNDHVLYITYEEMKMDLPGSIKKIAAHLGKKLSDNDVAAIAAHCSFDAMKSNKFVNFSWYKDIGIANKDRHFMRKGKIGDWKNHLSKDIQAKFDEMVATRLEPAGVRFKELPKADGE